MPKGRLSNSCKSAASQRNVCRCQEPQAVRISGLTVPVLGLDRVVEVKCRADGFRELYRLLIDRDILIVRADRSEPLVVLPLKLAAEIAAKAGAV